MTEKFPSKVSYGLLIIVMLFLIAPLFFIDIDIITKEKVLVGIINIIVALLILHTFLSTHYTIKGSHLKVKCGFLYQKTVDIHTIKFIENTSILLSAPAPSFDRILIDFTTDKTPLILSPKDKLQFIESLKAINPRIENRVAS